MKKSEQTRRSLLETAFRLIYVKGYQATSIDDIIRELNVTKGAFFYHFASKDEMGIAMIREVMRETMQREMEIPTSETESPLELIVQMMTELLMDHPFMQLKYGCPAYNLVQEMAPLNEGFNQELGLVINDARSYNKLALDRAVILGIIRQDVDTETAANFIMAGYGGIRMLGKLESTKEIYQQWLEELGRYLNSLK